MLLIASIVKNPSSKCQLRNRARVRLEVAGTSAGGIARAANIPTAASGRNEAGPSQPADAARRCCRPLGGFTSLSADSAAAAWPSWTVWWGEVADEPARERFFRLRISKCFITGLAMRARFNDNWNMNLEAGVAQPSRWHRFGYSPIGGATKPD